MAPIKISNLELEHLVKEGNGVSEIARKLGVTKGAISKRLKSLSAAITKDVSLHHAGEIVERKINSIDQLQKINDKANELLDQAMRFIRGEEENADLMKDPREVALKAMQEIRGQLRLQLEIFQTLYDMTAVAEFQKEVLEAIGNASPEIRARIIHNLQKTRAIRTTLDFY